MDERNDITASESSENIKQYVSFSISDEVFGVEVMKIQEVLGSIELTNVPKTMPFMKGVIDLRNIIVPIIDLRVKFGLDEKLHDKETVTLIAEIKGFLIGLIVDSVSDVISMKLEDIQSTPHFSSEIESDAVLGIGKNNEKIIIILNVDKIFNQDELNLLVQKESA